MAINRNDRACRVSGARAQRSGAQRSGARARTPPQSVNHSTPIRNAAKRWNTESIATRVNRLQTAFEHEHEHRCAEYAVQAFLCTGDLLVSQGVDWIESAGSPSRVIPEADTNGSGENQGHNGGCSADDDWPFFTGTDVVNQDR